MERRLECLESDGHRAACWRRRSGNWAEVTTCHRKETGGFVRSVGSHWRLCSCGGIGINVHFEKIPLALFGNWVLREKPSNKEAGYVPKAATQTRGHHGLAQGSSWDLDVQCEGR